ncbi:hypothetical protein TRVA0_008S02190 [Trichomonascus vanleenenianus]|uniref:mRNA splicing protein PRP45 n=1 Tax=Trichomonascus vanleenenianus TaxID=2268995 RepID=UPI003EC9FC45
MSTIGSLLPTPRNNAKRETRQEEEESHVDIPPYGQRESWKPTSEQDFGEDGGAYPEVHIAQYPQGMGAKESKRSNALVVRVDEEGNADYNAIARYGHDEDRVVQASYSDLIPLRQRANAGEVSLDKPSEAETQENVERTRQALAKIVDKRLESQRPRTIAKQTDEPTYVRYTSGSQMGGEGSKQRMIRVKDRQVDPFAPAKFQRPKQPRKNPSPPPPVLRSPPRKMTAQEQEDWYIPPTVSSWKNPKGFTIALDKRVAADGRSMHQPLEASQRNMNLAEALLSAESAARESLKQHKAMEAQLAEREQEEREEELRKLARQAREERQKIAKPQSDEEEEERDMRRRSRWDRERSVERAPIDELRQSPSDKHRRSPSDERLPSDDKEEEKERAAARREAERRDRRKEREKELRLSRMGGERRAKALAREQGRDISEKVALGMARPTKATGESQFDSRLFNQGAVSAGFSEDQVYDRSLFAAQEGINSIYRARGGTKFDEEGEMDRFDREKRFEALGSAQKGFLGSQASTRQEGPVEFVKEDDPDRADKMIREVQYGLSKSQNDHSEDEDDDDRSHKRQRR